MLFCLKKLLGLVIWSGEIVSLLIISLITSSTLNSVFFNFFSINRIMTIKLFHLECFFIIFIFYVVICFRDLSHIILLPFLKSRILVYLTRNFELYSIVINVGVDVKRAVELVNKIPLLELFNDNVEVLPVDPDPIKFSVTINRTFYLFKDLYLFSLYSPSILGDFKMLSQSSLSVFDFNFFVFIILRLSCSYSGSFFQFGCVI